MEPNKIENQFRKKLNSREIQPSAPAWDRLDAMLAVAEPSESVLAKQNQKKINTWFLIAASCIGFMLVATIFFNQNQISTKKGAAIAQNTSIPKTINKSVKEIVLPKTKPNIENLALISVPKKSIVKQKHTGNIINIKNTNQESVAQNSIINQKNEQKTITEKTINGAVDERIAVVENPSKSEKLFNKSSAIKVDASNLLSQVDGELALSFREKVIKTVAKNYKEAKVALNNRNNEQ